MARVETWFDQDLLKPVPIRQIGSIYSQDALGNRIGVNVTKDGESVTLSGTVNGYIILPDGSHISCPGYRSGNKAYINLPANAYSIIGPISIAVKLTDGSSITTLCDCVAIVVQTRTGVSTDPGQAVIDSWEQQIAAELQQFESVINQVVIATVAETKSYLGIS